MTRIITKLFAIAVLLTAFLPIQPSFAERVAFVSATGGGTACSQTAPCASIDVAVSAVSPDGGQIICMTPVEQTSGFGFISETIVFDCPSTSWLGGIGFFGGGVFKFQHIDFNGLNVAPNMIKVTGGGTLILEDCVLEDVAGTALDIEPTGPFNLVMKNSRISNNTGGVLLKPASGGGVNATLDHVVITGNTGTSGGIKTDSANGPITLDIYNSTVSNNVGVGVNARSGGSLNMVSIKNSVITQNTAQGVQANGANVGVMVQTTLFDQNASGATLVAAGGHISTYGNNSIVGSSGSGFTGTASLQ
jgi:hypothetical protein